MKKSDTFTDRRKDAEAAKDRLLDKFKARQSQDNPRAAERAVARKAQSAAQAQRNANTAVETKNKLQALKAETEAAEAIRQHEQQSSELMEAAREEQLKKTAEIEEAQEISAEADRKAKRDARYASRKARC